MELRVESPSLRRPDYDFPLQDLATDLGSRGRVFRMVPPGSLVLDVGCDTGRFGEALQRERGCTVDGVELFPQAAATARTRLRRVMERAADGPDGLRDLRGYDVVLFLDVLEHLVDPWKVLGEARAALRPGGLLITVVPNIAHISVVRRLLQGRFTYEDTGTMDRTHLRWFTLRSMADALHGAGFTDVRVDGVPLIPRLDGPSMVAGVARRVLGATFTNLLTGSIIATARTPTERPA